MKLYPSSFLRAALVCLGLPFIAALAQAQNATSLSGAGYINLTSLSWSPSPAQMTQNTATFLWYPSQGVLRIGTFTTTSQANSSSFGANSTAIGYSTLATGTGSTAIGYNAAATGTYSVALGWGTADGYYSTAQGLSTSVAWGETAVGLFNAGLNKSGSAPNPSSSSTSDPIFEVGIGSSSSAPLSALVVFGDGTVRLSKPSGGISMGPFD